MNITDQLLANLIKEHQQEIRDRFNGCEGCWMAANLSCTKPCSIHPNATLQKLWEDTGMVDLWK